MIKKIDFPSTPMPSKNEDWEKLMNIFTILASRNSDISIFKNGFDLSEEPVIAEGSVFVHGGSILFVEQDIELPSIISDGTYILVLNEELNFELVEDISDYRVSLTYGGMYDGKKQALPFVVEKNEDEYHKGRVLNIQYRYKEAFIYLFDTGRIGGKIVLDQIKGQLIIEEDLKVYGNLLVEGSLYAQTIDAETIIAEAIFAP